MEKDFKQKNENSLKSAIGLNQEYDQIKNEISKENLRVQELKTKNDEIKQLTEQTLQNLASSKNELNSLKEKLFKAKEEKSRLVSKVKF